VKLFEDPDESGVMKLFALKYGESLLFASAPYFSWSSSWSGFTPRPFTHSLTNQVGVSFPFAAVALFLTVPYCKTELALHGI